MTETCSLNCYPVHCAKLSHLGIQNIQYVIQDNEIGQNHALFYMAYSAFMELRGNFGKAEAIFEMGLNRLGHQKKRLQLPCFGPLIVNEFVICVHASSWTQLTWPRQCI